MLKFRHYGVFGVHECRFVRLPPWLGMCNDLSAGARFMRVRGFPPPPVQQASRHRHSGTPTPTATMGPRPAAGFDRAGHLDEWAARIDKKIHQEGGQIRFSSLGGFRLPVVLQGCIRFGEALELCGFQRAGGPGRLDMVKPRSLAARADRALTTMPPGGFKQRQRRAAASLPANATLSSLASAVNKRVKPAAIRPADRPRPAGHVGKAGSVHFKAPHLDPKEAERRKQRAGRFETVSSGHQAPSKWQEQLRQSQPPPLTVCHTGFEPRASGQGPRQVCYSHVRVSSYLDTQAPAYYLPTTPLQALKELEPKSAGHVRYLQGGLGSAYPNPHPD